MRRNLYLQVELLQDVYHGLADIFRKIVGKATGEVVDPTLGLPFRQDHSVKAIAERFRVNPGQFFYGNVPDLHAFSKSLKQPIASEFGEDLRRVEKLLVCQQTEDELLLPVQPVFFDQLRPQLREDLIVTDAAGAIDNTGFTEEA